MKFVKNSCDKSKLCLKFKKSLQNLIQMLELKKDQSLWSQKRYMKANGSENRAMAGANRLGQTEVATKENGEMIKLMEMES